MINLILQKADKKDLESQLAIYIIKACKYLSIQSDQNIKDMFAQDYIASLVVKLIDVNNKTLKHESDLHNVMELIGNFTTLDTKNGDPEITMMLI